MKQVNFPRTVIATAIASLACFAMVGLHSCSKDGMQGIYIVSGKIYAQCDKVPFANQPIQLVHFTATSTSYNGTIRVTETDASGNFRFEYTDSYTDFSYSDEYQIALGSTAGSGKVILSRIPGRSTVDVGEIYADNKSKVYVQVNTTNSFPATDTLYFGINEDEFYSINPVVTVAGVYTFSASAALYNNRSSAGNFFYAIGLSNYRAALAAPSVFNNTSFEDRGCGAIADTVVLQLP